MKSKIALVILAAIAVIWWLFGRKKTSVNSGQTYDLKNGVKITYGDTPGSATITYPDGKTTELSNGEVPVDVIVSQGVDIETAILLSANSKAWAAYSDAVDAAQAATGYSTETAGYHYDENGNWVPDNTYLTDPAVAIAKCKVDIANYETLVHDLENNPSLSTSALVQERLAWARAQLEAARAALAALEAGGTVSPTDTASWTVGNVMTVTPAGGTVTATQTASTLKAAVGSSVPDLSTLDNARADIAPPVPFAPFTPDIAAAKVTGEARSLVQSLIAMRNADDAAFTANRSKYLL